MQLDDDQQLQLTYLVLDPSGRLGEAMGVVQRYKRIVRRQHLATLVEWQAKRFPSALVELHFMLIAIDRVKDGVALASQAVGTLTALMGNIDLTQHKRARDHFEHIEDRLFGSRKNALRPVVGSNGMSRTTHYGLRTNPMMQFYWGDQAADISSAFVDAFEAWVQRVEDEIEAELKRAGLA